MESMQDWYAAISAYADDRTRAERELRLRLLATDRAAAASPGRASLARRLWRRIAGD